MVQKRSPGKRAGKRLFGASLFALLCFFIPSPVAQAQYRFDNWTTDNGLPQNSVYAITQTRDGYIWLTTSDGLVRFDGVRFTVFDQSNTRGITSNRLTDLYEDPEGTLWIGSQFCANGQRQFLASQGNTTQAANFNCLTRIVLNGTTAPTSNIVPAVNQNVASVTVPYRRNT